jgi:peptidoglycan glycosyltransferase
MLNAMIVSAVANGGVMMKPYVVDHIENAYEIQIKKYSSQENSTPMTKEEASSLAKMMRKVVTDGTAKDLKDMKVKAAGKTGSADHGEGRAHSWFIGYAPYDKPEIAVSIVVENAGTGSEYAVPIAAKIFDAYFNK